MGFKNALFVVSHSDTYIVSMQQTVHSALSRGFEPCSAPGSMCAKASKIGRVSATVQARLVAARQAAALFLGAGLERRQFVLSCRDLL